MDLNFLKSDTMPSRIVVDFSSSKFYFKLLPFYVLISMEKIYNLNFQGTNTTFLCLDTHGCLKW
jgi:hypothetical protein